MQFDVHRNPGKAAEWVPYLVTLQHRRAGVLGSEVVAPLLWFSPRDDLGRLTPVVVVEGKKCLVSVAEVFTIDKRRLGPVVGNLESERDRIIRALDFLFTGI